MKRKKILAGILAVVMVLVSVPGIHFTVLAADETTSSAEIATQAEDVLASSHGYENLQLGSNDVTLTTSSNALAQTYTSINKEIFNSASTNGSVINTNASRSVVQVTDQDALWINIHLESKQKVTGLLYYFNKGMTNGHIKIAKIEVKTEDSTDYQTVYKNTIEWTTGDLHEALFTPVSDVTDVRVTGIKCASKTGATVSMMGIDYMRILTVPENEKVVTVTASTGDVGLGSVAVDVDEDNNVSSVATESQQLQVMPGVRVKYQAIPASDLVEFVGWKDTTTDKFVSGEKTYETTIKSDASLEAVFKEIISEHLVKIDIPTDGGIPEKKAATGEGTHITNPVNIKESSGMNPSAWNDGTAWCAFNDNENNWWHSEYTRKPGNINTTTDFPGAPSNSNPAWIQAGFTQNYTNAEAEEKKKKVKKIIYRSRTGDGTTGVGIKYQVLAANVENLEPADDDFAVVQTGELIATHEEQSIVLDHTIEATHIRLRFISSSDPGSGGVPVKNYPTGMTVTASKVEMYENTDATTDDRSLKEIVPIAVTSADITRGTVTHTTTKGQLASPENVKYIAQDGDTPVTITAIANAGYHFVKWNVKDTETNKIIPDEVITSKSATIIMNDNTRSYEAVFAPDDLSVNLEDNTSLYLKKWTEGVDNTYTSGTATLKAKVRSESTTLTEEEQEVVWTSTKEDVAAVDDTGLITPVAEGTTTIRATSVLDESVCAECEVTVNDMALGDTTLESEIGNIKTEIGDISDDAVYGNTNEGAVKYKYTKDSLDTLRDTYKEAKTDIKTDAKTLLMNLQNAYDNLTELYQVTIDKTGLENIASDITITSAYTKEHMDYRTSTDTTESIYVPFITKVYINAPETNSSSAKFKQWTDGTKKICEEAYYAFYVIGDVTYKPEYGETVEENPEDKVIRYCTTKYITKTDQVAFIAKRSLPKDFTVKQHGIVITDETGWNLYYGPEVAERKEIKLQGIRTKRAIASGHANNGTYEAKTPRKDTNWYGRSFVTFTYTDSNGETKEQTVYSEITEYIKN